MNMNRRRSSFTPIALSLLMVCAAWGAPPALAASTAVVPISGTVDGVPESVYFSGLAEIATTLMTDPDLGTRPGVMLSIDLHNVTGQGLATGATYVSTAQDQVIRRLVSADRIEISFPFHPSVPGGETSARGALASFSLTFDLRTGEVTGGGGTVSSPSF